VKAPIFIGRAFFFGVADRHIDKSIPEIHGDSLDAGEPGCPNPEGAIGEYEV